jgi:uncharacterized protein
VFQAVVFLITFLLGSGELDGFVETKASPSFDCHAPSAPVEIVICNDEEVGDLDGKMADLYQHLMDDGSDTERGALREEQVYWLARRTQTCHLRRSNELTVENALHARTCLVAMYKARVARLGSKWPLSIDWLMERPETLTRDTAYSTFVSSRPSGAEAREELRRLKDRFPFQRFSLFRPYGDHKYWAVVVASYTSFQNAKEAENLAKTLGIASDAFVDHLPLPPEEALDWTPEPSRQTVLECLAGGANSIQEMYACSGGLMTPATLDTCIKDGHCNLETTPAAMDQYLAAEKLTWDSSLAVQPGYPNLTTLSNCLKANGSDEPGFNNCAIQSFNDPKMLFGCANGEGDRNAVARCLLKNVPGFDPSVNRLFRPDDMQI